MEHDARFRPDFVATILAASLVMLALLGPVNQITARIIAAAIEVHRTLGPGLLESVYLACLLYEMRLAGLNVESQKKIPVVYKGIVLDSYHVLDLLVEGIVIVETKCLGMVLPAHEAQLMTQLKLANKPVGLLLNFNVPVMKDGITRKLNRQAMNP